MVYVGALFVLVLTIWLVMAGAATLSDIGDLARLGLASFQFMASLQLAVMLFFSALLGAGAVAAEKDRRTLDLLLLTQLSNTELVLGKLLASLVATLPMIVAAIPLFAILTLLGGVTPGQIARVFAIVCSSAVAAGSLGCLVAFWREKTFQSLAVTLLLLVGWLAAGEAIDAGALGEAPAGTSAHAWAAAISPWRATLWAMRPFSTGEEMAFQQFPSLGPTTLYLIFAVGVTLLANLTAIALVRVWNPSREQRTSGESDERAPAAAEPQRWTIAGRENPAAPLTIRQHARTRQVWDNPILWREVRTWAYGRRTLMLRVAYLALFAASAVGLYWAIPARGAPETDRVAMLLAPLAVLSLVLINVQAVTALTSERDARALDLLLVTDVTPREFIVGKLAGALYNTKEMALAPLALCVYLHFRYVLGLENLLYLTLGWSVMVGFVLMLGVHCGMNYVNSRTAISISMGTVFFLFIGIATCMRIMVAFSGAFTVQLQPFLLIVAGGGFSLVAALGWRNASTAIWIASFVVPFATFYALTSFLNDQTLGVFLAVAAAYGFTTAAMLIPAVYEFDVATGRTTGEGD
jgi:ABC-type transport system involved in multi-copper enzyme maturation permease subunit